MEADTCGLRCCSLYGTRKWWVGAQARLDITQCGWCDMGVSEAHIKDDEEFLGEGFRVSVRYRSCSW